jgi:hypothetical protein
MQLLLYCNERSKMPGSNSLTRTVAAPVYDCESGNQERRRAAPELVKEHLRRDERHRNCTSYLRNEPNFVETRGIRLERGSLRLTYRIACCVTGPIGETKNISFSRKR